MNNFAIHSQFGRRQTTAVATTQVQIKDIADWLAAAFTDTAAAVRASGGHIVGPPFARYHQLESATFGIEAGFPTDVVIADTGRVHASELPEGEQAVIDYIGPYGAMQGAYQALYGWVAEHRGMPTGDAWEVYYTDPSAEPDVRKWRTEVFLPYRVGQTATSIAV